MSRLYFTVGIAALGMILASPQPQAAVRAGVTTAMPQPDGSGSNLTCRYCAISRTPRPGDTVTLNPQPLPPRITGSGRMLRR
ncbi:MAG: hypothetical protein QOF90_3781 [Acetobacteraceae bacterium]|nr:hypothetical protein [Acetobacteraceae bacterium]